MDKSDRDISQWDARLKEQLDRSFHNYHKRRIDLSIARDHKKYNWTGETLIVEKASSPSASATVRLMFEDADELTLGENVEINSIFNRVFLSNAAQPDEWIDIIAGINFSYKKKVADGLKFVNRGDPASEDFGLGDFTFDDAYHDLDLSGIIPEGVKVVLFTIEMNTAASRQRVAFMKKGQINTLNIAYALTQVANMPIVHDLFVVPDSSRFIEYQGSSGVWNTLSMTIRGWFV